MPGVGNIERRGQQTQGATFLIKLVSCPICQELGSNPRFKPFCSERCRQIDFVRWWDGKYAIAEPLSEHLEHFDSPSPDSNDQEATNPDSEYGSFVQ